MAKPATDYSHLRLFEGDHWSVELHPRQTYLGRSLAVLKRKLVDPLECTVEERNELWENMLPTYQLLVTKAFQPARINYGHLANDHKQVHWHLVPRYEDPPEREFAGVTFIDPNVGHNFAPSPPVPKDVTDEVVQKIRAELTKHLPA